MQKIKSFIICVALMSCSKNFPEQKLISKLSDYEIDAIAPAFKTPLETILALKSLKLKLHLPNDSLDDPSVLFFANTDQVRFNCLKKALFAENNHIVWALRGGYGTARLIDDLVRLPKPKTEKIVIGYSDITALHLFLSQEWGWKTIHGAILKELIEEEKDSINFYKITQILNNEFNSVSLQELSPLNKAADLKGEKIKGLLTGGNLTLIENSIGTKWQIQTKNKIIFLEDVNVQPYQIDRMLMHLSQSGIFENVEAIVFGSFLPDDKLILQVLTNFAQNTMIPVYHTPTFGHAKLNYPLIYNSIAEIKRSQNQNFELIMDVPKYY